MADRLQNLNRQQRRAAVKYRRVENGKLSEIFQTVPADQWTVTDKTPPWKVWVNNQFLVQAFREENDVIRLSINRTTLKTSGDWSDGISWDDLQTIKNGVGFSAEMAVEVFPPAQDVVNVANLRHLWVLPIPLPFMWRKR